MVNDDGDQAGEAALTAALEAMPVAIEALRRTVRIVLSCHLAELADGADAWPLLTPSAALTDLGVGECSILDHVDAVAERVLQQLGRAPVRH